jgi:putative transposase
MGFYWSIKSKTAIKTFKQFPSLREKPDWGNEFWLKGYCVDTFGLDEEMIRKYVKHQERKDRYVDQLKFGFK